MRSDLRSVAAPSLAFQPHKLPQSCPVGRYGPLICQQPLACVRCDAYKPEHVLPRAGQGAMHPLQLAVKRVHLHIHA